MKSGAKDKYDVMDIKNICQFPINATIADDNCILCMWWVGSQPQEALNLVKAWGFTLKTMTGFTWIKKTKHWKDWFGMGFLTRQGSENMLFATRGNIKRMSAGIRALIKADEVISVKARSEGHSIKPDIFRDLIVDLMGDLPRIELFARNKVPGWDSWGNEIESDIIFGNNKD